MLNINQNMKGYNKNYDIIVDKDPYTLNISTDLILKDSNTLVKSLSQVKNKLNLKNINTIINYLNKLASKVKDNELEVCWSIKNDQLIQYPISLRSFDEYNISSIDYINIENENMYVLNFRGIADAVAFEYMYRDLGYTHDEAEDIFKYTGLASPNEIKPFKEYLEQENLHPYIFSKSAKVGSSPYMDIINKKIKSYFGDKEFRVYDGVTYQEVVEYSIDKILCCIVGEIIKNAANLGIDFKLISISGTSVVITTEDTDVNIDELMEEFKIRIFGRYFNIKPDISTF